MKQKLLLSLTITFISLVSIAQTVTEVPTPPPLDTLNKVFSNLSIQDLRKSQCLSDTFRGFAMSRLVKA